MIVSHLSEILGRRRASIQDLARGAQIAYGTALGLYHHSNKQISFATLERVCTYLEVQPGDLFTFKSGSAK